MALALLIAQTLFLVAGLSLFAQVIVGAFNWRRRKENVVYQLFEIVSRPVEWIVRRITPRIVVDQHVPMVTFLLLVFGYFAVGFWHRDVCLGDLAQPGCERWVSTRTGAAQ